MIPLHKIFFRSQYIIAVIFACIISLNSNAQSSNIPPEAQQILNSLPPMQRQLAINKINDYEKENRNSNQSFEDQTQPIEDDFYNYVEPNNEFYNLGYIRNGKRYVLLDHFQILLSKIIYGLVFRTKTFI